MSDEQNQKQILQLERRLNLSGFKRARVVQTDINSNDYGVIRVFIPSLMTDLIPDPDYTKQGIYAWPGNNNCGGRNPDQVMNNKEAYYQGSVNIPAVNSWVWVFFEDLNINRCFYGNAVDIENTMLPPENRLNEENKKLDSPHRVHTLYKSHEGRAIQVSDSSDTARVEITGKKHMLMDGDTNQTLASGDQESAYNIDGNMTTILLDEASRGEDPIQDPPRDKLLVRDHKGNFINLWIENGSLHAQLDSLNEVNTDQNNINLHIKGNTFTNIDTNVNTTIGNTEYKQVKYNSYELVNNNKLIQIDGNLKIIVGDVKPSISPIPVQSNPQGERDT